MAGRLNDDLGNEFGKDLRSRTRSSESEAESNKLKLAQAADWLGTRQDVATGGAGKEGSGRLRLILNEGRGQERSPERTAASGV